MKEHVSNGVKLVAVCDSDILGKVLEDEELGLEVSESFYRGEEIDAGEASRVLKSGTDLNLAGNEIVGLGVKLGVVDSSCVLVIAGVKHAEVIFREV